MSDALRELKDKAAQLTAKGKVPAALEAWLQVVRAAPDEVSARHKVAELLARQGKSGEAVRAYEDVANRFAAQGMFFKASAVCRLILGLEPGHQRTKDLIASLYSRGKKATPPPPPVDEPQIVVGTAIETEVELDIEIDVIAPPTASGLPSIPLFSMLTADELKEILGTAMEVRSFAAGEVVIAEGAPGESMFALVEGDAGVFRGWGTPAQRRVASLSQGEIFGEVALVSRAPRLAAVVTDGDAVALEFSREAMQKVITRHSRVGQMLEAFYRERLLANAFRANPSLRGLPEVDKKRLLARFKPRTFTDGQRIITEGQAPESVHVILRGVCAAAHQSGERYPDLREGDLFGEVSVLLDGPATATVSAVGAVLTLELPAGEFKALVMADPAAALAVKLRAKERLARTAQFDREYGVEVGADTRV